MAAVSPQSIDSIPESIKARLDELEPGEEYDSLVAALDALDPDTDTSADEA